MWDGRPRPERSAGRARHCSVGPPSPAANRLAATCFATWHSHAPDRRSFVARSFDLPSATTPSLNYLGRHDFGLALRLAVWLDLASAPHASTHDGGRHLVGRHRHLANLATTNRTASDDRGGQ